MATVPTPTPPAPSTVTRRPTTGYQQPPAAGGAPKTTQIDAYTPPGMKGRSWLGVDPNSKITTSLAREGLQGYLGGDVTPYMSQVQSVLSQHGYNDPTFGQDLTGTQYNALLQAGAELTGNTFTPWSTTNPTGEQGPPPPPEGVAPPPAPEIDVPEYQRRGDFRYDPSQIANDPGYQFEFAEGQRALENAASARGGTRNTNTMRDLVSFGQGLAATRGNEAFQRQLSTYNTNVGDDRYAHEASVNRATTQFAPRLLDWERNRDERQRDKEMNFDRDWQREIYGRDDSWRRHVYANDDAWRRYQLEENRRLKVADMGMN